jgi:hypothetical protein
MQPRWQRKPSPIIRGIATALVLAIVLPYAISLTILPELTDPYPPADAELQPWINGLAGVIWAAAITIGCLVGWRTHRKNVRVADATHCRQCGYDLTGNVSGRCPECGEAVAATDSTSHAGQREFDKQTHA